MFPSARGKVISGTDFGSRLAKSLDKLCAL